MHRAWGASWCSCWRRGELLFEGPKGIQAFWATKINPTILLGHGGTKSCVEFCFWLWKQNTGGSFGNPHRSTSDLTDRSKPLPSLGVLHLQRVSWTRHLGAHFALAPFLVPWSGATSCSQFPFCSFSVIGFVIYTLLCDRFKHPAPVLAILEAGPIPPAFVPLPGLVPCATGMCKDPARDCRALNYAGPCPSFLGQYS